MVPALARLLPLCAAALLALGGPAHAQSPIDAGGLSAGDGSVSYSEIVTIEAGVADGGAADKARFAEWSDGEARPSAAPIASYGPFHLVAPDTIEMIGTVDAGSPGAFAALVAAHPGVARLVMVDCPGSVDEDANHALARAVRRAGLETVVPDGGSVRSGAVDLFLAGVTRHAAPSAEFGVHSWRDEDGMEAGDFAPSDPVHGEYLRYYREMGLDAATAERFYALTNSVGFDDVRYLGAADMARLGLAEVTGQATPH